MAIKTYTGEELMEMFGLDGQNSDMKGGKYIIECLAGKEKRTQGLKYPLSTDTTDLTQFLKNPQAEYTFRKIEESTYTGQEIIEMMTNGKIPMKKGKYSIVSTGRNREGYGFTYPMQDTKELQAFLRNDTNYTIRRIG